MTAVIDRYPATGQTGIQVYSHAEPYVTLSVAVPGISLAPDEVIVPDYNLDHDLITQLTNQGFWEFTNRLATLPFNDAPIYRLKVSLD